jgi:LysM repeat protein
MLLKKFVPAVVCCLLAITSFCQNESKVAEYINKYKEIAIREMIRSGVPASITLAQGILESQSGESNLAKRSNNHFGIKCKTEWTGAKTYHDDDEKGECFRVYNSVEESYVDHSDFLKNRPYYTFLFKLDPTDYEGWAKGLKKAGYATSSTYAQQLISLIQRYNLQEHTLVALQRSKQQQDGLFAYASEEKTVAPVVTTLEITSDTPKKTEEIIQPAVRTEEPKKAIEAEQTVETKAVATPAIYNAADYPESPFTINLTKVILAKEGTSLLALANEFGVSYKKLLEFNELDESTDILGYDQLIFLAKKPKKGSKDIHIVEKNETLEIISQKEGVQLEALLAYNRIPKGRQPIVGEKIYLKANSPVTPKLAASN